MTSSGHRVFSGMRPSGRLHVGNYVGALQNWVAMQDEFECIYCAVDVHALTDMQGEDTREIRPNVHEMVLDWLAAGIDPDRSLVFAQSQVPEVMVLHTLLSMVTPLGWLMRVPTFKDKVRQMQETEESVSYGLVGYPVLMTADIILYKADTVPVGEDQLPHLELAQGDCPPLQPPVRPDVPGAAGPADGGAAGRRLGRRAQDEQEPGQPHRAGRHAGGNRRQDRNGLHRP